MAVTGPAIPFATLKTSAGEETVSIASDRWWRQIPTLRQASQQNRLACPDCGERIVLVSEHVPVPYFKHWRDTQECIPPSGSGQAVSDRRARAWLRHQVVLALREILPDGTPLECEAYLAGLRSSLTINPGAKGSAVIEVSMEPPDLGDWTRRREAHAASGLPVFYLFAGERVPSVVRSAKEGRGRQIRILGALNADVIQAIRQENVDILHAVYNETYGLDRLAERPGTLYYFLPGRSSYEVGALVILRGLLPHVGATVWSGVAVRAPMVEGKVRFSRRHGFYTEADLAVLVKSRRHFRLLRAKGHKFDPQGPATSHCHPIVSAWLQRVARLEAERTRTRKQPVQFESAAAPTPAPQVDMAVHDDYAHLLSVLYADGASLLNGRTLPCTADLYEAEASFWQSLLIGFFYRAGIRFEIRRAVTWLRIQELVMAEKLAAVERDLMGFWSAAAGLGLLNPRAGYSWRYDSGRDRVHVPSALCIICATTTTESERRRTEAWRLYDPENRLCKCVRCWESVR